LKRCYRSRSLFPPPLLCLRQYSVGTIRHPLFLSKGAGCSSWRVPYVQRHCPPPAFYRARNDESTCSLPFFPFELGLNGTSHSCQRLPLPRKFFFFLVMINCRPSTLARCTISFSPLPAGKQVNNRCSSAVLARYNRLGSLFSPSPLLMERNCLSSPSPPDNWQLHPFCRDCISSTVLPPPPPPPSRP